MTGSIGARLPKTGSWVSKTPAEFLAIRITDTSVNFEIDHLQYGRASSPNPNTVISGIPEPISAMLGVMGLAALGYATRRRTA